MDAYGDTAIRSALERRSNWMALQRNFAGLAAVALLASGVASPGLAEEAAGEDPEAETEPLWEWYMAGFGRYGAVYPGSSENQFNIIPLPFPRYRGKFFRLGEETENPLRGKIFRRDRVKLDIDFDINFGEDSDDIDVRKGMPDLDFILEVGPELSLQFAGERNSKWRAYLNLPVRAAFSWPGFDPRYQGLVFAPEIRLRNRYTENRKDEISFRITPQFATSEYMNYFYGVRPEFANSLRPAFKAESGYLGTELGISARKVLASRYELVGGVALGLLDGAKNRNSPLFEDDVNASVFVAFLWKFWESKRRVEVLPD
ncbi:MAG: MipA/OmpV family protein [Gammaproteobacteria bacterium]|nr:MipA/OmpV family protein [Gammaproteobacteria bacterium]